jgi:hypothetical protein
LPRDTEGWTLVDSQRTSKLKQSLIVLLREFSSEIDKWRMVRSRGGKARKKNNGADDAMTPDWTAVIKKLYGDDCPIPRLKSQMAPSVRAEIEAEIGKGLTTRD